jgi:peroxiredoxin
VEFLIFLFYSYTGYFLNYIKKQMKKTINLFWFSFLLLLILGDIPVYSQVKNQVNINGNIKNNTFSSASLYQIGKDALFISSSTIGSDNKFSFICDIAKTDLYKIQFDNNNFVMLILQPGEKVEITIDANDFLKQLVVNGSENTSDIYRNQNILLTTKTKLDSISNLSYKEMANPKYDSLLKVYTASYANVKTDQDNTLKSFILKNPKSLAILFLLEALPIDANYDTYSMVDSTLFASYPDNFYVNNLHSQIVAGKATAIGVLAPDFILPDTSGRNISLSSFHGKYLLIDFWAAWCGPCRKEMPNMVKIYSDFKGKNFEILGVSLDKTRDKWVAAIRSEHMTWPQVSDLKFWQSEVAALYSVKAIPYTILLDKEGKIIVKNLRGEELYKKVESLLK